MPTVDDAALRIAHHLPQDQERALAAYRAGLVEEFGPLKLTERPDRIDQFIDSLCEHVRWRIDWLESLPAGRA